VVAALQAVPNWFLIFALVLIGSLFIRAMNHSFTKLEKTLDRFEELLDKVFEKHEDHESRLSKLEGAHESNHRTQK
jgi:hypothetical protein